MKRHRLVDLAILILYGCATLQLARFYTVSSASYLNIPAYLTGHERLPFQERVLPVLFMKPFYGSGFLSRFAGHANGAFTAEKAGFFVVSFLGLVVAGVFTMKLYDRLTRIGSLRFLVYPLFLFTVTWSYIVHVEANFAYPYDLPALAFFTAGVYFIYTEQFIPLVLVMLLGTANRETTLFLIGIYILDRGSKQLDVAASWEQGRFSLTRVPWLRVVLLTGVWVAVKLTLMQIFAHNNASESYYRTYENIGRLKPRLWPALLNICGYLLPVVLLFQRKLYPARFRNYLWIFPVWVAVMFCTGVIVETRVYGELSAFAATAAVLIAERYAESRAVGHYLAERGDEEEPALDRAA